MCWSFETWADYKERMGKWHRWFAWHPVTVGHGKRCWLMWVERRGDYWGSWHGDGWDMEYRNVSA